MREPDKSLVSPLITDCEGSFGVEGTLVVISSPVSWFKTQKSEKVPPVSMPILYVVMANHLLYNALNRVTLSCSQQRVYAHYSSLLLCVLNIPLTISVSRKIWWPTTPLANLRFLTLPRSILEIPEAFGRSTPKSSYRHRPMPGHQWFCHRA